MVKIPTLLYSTVIILLLGCESNQANHAPQSKTPAETNDQNKNSLEHSQSKDMNILKVFVDKSGVISANGVEGISLDDLESKLKTVKSKNGMVYYSRDNVAGDPPKQAMDVIELVVKYELPLKFYTDKTFTEEIKLTAPRN